MTKNNFHKIVGKGKWVLLDFYTNNCKYCFKLYPEYNKLIHAFNNPKSKLNREDLVIAKINGDKNGKIADQYNVESYPTVMLFAPNDTTFPVEYKYEHKVNDMSMFLNAHLIKSGT